MDDFEARLSDSGDEDETDQPNNDANLSADEIAANKLKHNIAKKGANSYYYAHAKKADAPTVRNEPPQLLENAQKNLAKVKAVQPFEKFAWANGTKVVSIYLTHLNADKIPDDKITLYTEKKSFEVKVEDETGRVFGLKIDKLNGEIDGADIKKKVDKLVVLLKKVEERTWYKLEE
jgi:hypothetical protein